MQNLLESEEIQKLKYEKKIEHVNDLFASWSFYAEVIFFFVIGGVMYPLGDDVWYYILGGFNLVIGMFCLILIGSKDIINSEVNFLLSY